MGGILTLPIFLEYFPEINPDADGISPAESSQRSTNQGESDRLVCHDRARMRLLSIIKESLLPLTTWAASLAPSSLFSLATHWDERE